jgi:hypothetical protein
MGWHTETTDGSDSAGAINNLGNPGVRKHGEKN